MEGAAEVVSTGRGAVGVLEGRCESKPGSREDVYEEIFEVCCEFLDERVPGDSIIGRSADHVDCKGEKEEREFYDEHRACRDYAEWSNNGGGDFSQCNFCRSDDCDHAESAERNDHDGTQDDNWTGQAYDSGAATVAWDQAFGRMISRTP